MVSIGFSMMEAWPMTVTAEAPISHMIVEIGEARKPNGTATKSNPVYSWEVLYVPNGVIKSWPCSLLIPMIPKKVNRITNRSNRFVSNVYMNKQETIRV